MNGRRRAATPTQVQAKAYQAMFDHFNRVLFGGELSHVLLNFSRRANTLGFFAPKRWVAGEEDARRDQLEPELPRAP